MPEKIVKDYYIKQKAKLMKNFSNYTNDIQNFLVGKFSDSKIDKILKQISKEFETLIPKIPYIGGAKNPFSIAMIQIIYSLAIFRILENEGLSYREIGELYFELVEGDLRLEKENLEKIGKDPAKYLFEIEYINLQKSFAEYSQKRTYPYDFVMDYVEGDGISFDYGLNFTECGVYKLFKELGAEKYVPLVCMVRILKANIFGYGVFRTKTLATGAPACDYRYVKKLKSPQKITEEEVTYFKEKKICLVCKGNIEGFNIFICPKCEVLYCENCARTLIDLENACWACNTLLDKSKPSKPFKRKEDDKLIKKDSKKNKVFDQDLMN